MVNSMAAIRYLVRDVLFQKMYDCFPNNMIERFAGIVSLHGYNARVVLNVVMVKV